MSEGTLIFTNIRITPQNTVELKVKGLGWVDMFDANLRSYNKATNIPSTRYNKVIVQAQKKRLVTIEKMGTQLVMKGGERYGRK